MPRQCESYAKELSTLLIVIVGICLFGLFNDGNLLTRVTGHDPNMAADTTSRTARYNPIGLGQTARNL
jgi:hypothetical protein